MSFSYETPKPGAFDSPQQAPYNAAQPGAYEAPNPAAAQAPYGVPQAAPMPNAAAYQAPNQAVAAKPKSKVVAGLLAIFLGSLGIHKFYLGYTQAAIIMLVVSLVGAIIVVGPIVMAIIALIEGILYLTKSDQEFYQIYVVGKRPWF